MFCTKKVWVLPAFLCSRKLLLMSLTEAEGPMQFWRQYTALRQTIILSIYSLRNPHKPPPPPHTQTSYTGRWRVRTFQTTSAHLVTWFTTGVWGLKVYEDQPASKGSLGLFDVGLHEVLIHSQCISYSRWRSQANNSEKQLHRSYAMYCCGQVSNKRYFSHLTL